MSAIGQIYYNIIDTNSTGEGKHYISSGIDIYSDVVNAYGAKQFNKLGIQCSPGTRVIMNTNKTIMIGRTGIYELDDDIAITNLKFVKPSNYIKNETKSTEKKQEGEQIIKNAKTALETAIAALGDEPSDPSSADYTIYWEGYSEATKTYITEFQRGSAILTQGLNGVYELDEENPYGDLENVIIDFVYEAV